MAEFTGRGQSYHASHRGGNSFMRYERAGGMTIEVAPVIEGAILQMSFFGRLTDIRAGDSDNICRFYDFDPGNYVVNSLWNGNTGAAWSVVVTPSTYTVTRISSTSPGGFVVQG